MGVPFLRHVSDCWFAGAKASGACRVGLLSLVHLPVPIVQGIGPLAAFLFLVFVIETILLLAMCVRWCVTLHNSSYTRQGCVLPVGVCFLAKSDDASICVAVYHSAFCNLSFEAALLPVCLGDLICAA